jgi:FtsP/CotA-like multicopper oxidase with cupredoxin domain
MRRMILLWIALWPPAALFAQTASEVCPRPSIGSAVRDPVNLNSTGGTLNVDLSFRSFVDRDKLTRYCYVYKDVIEAPTLRVQPGDEVVLTLRNQLPLVKSEAAEHVHGGETHAGCGGSAMTPSATNLHFHGLDLPPVCHQDETLRTLIQPSDPAFVYRFKIPTTASAGLYWYHPHPHGYTEPQVLGGASGALIVEGIERDKPEVAGLPQRVLILRDQPVPGISESDEDAGPGKDISLNFVPVLFPLYKPSQMMVKPSERQFWRVLNASADTYFDLQIRQGPTIQDVQDPQPLELVALDGAAISSVSDTKRNHILLAPGARAEFIVTTPPVGTYAQLVSLTYDSGPDGPSIPYRVIANIVSRREAESAIRMPAAPSAPRALRPLDEVTPARQRKLYFSEAREDAKSPQNVKYFITVDGEAPKVFDMNFKDPNITVRQGTVEEWTIENRARDAHAFHIHQLHFQVMERDGQRLDEPMLRDTIDLPYWDGKSERYPSVKLRMDFRNPDIVGTFVYHCHILEHEDGGMMGVIRVKPAKSQ